MIKQTRTFFALAILALAGSVVPAQAIEFGQMKVNVPFAFRAGTVTLPAGDYNFIRASDSGLIRINGPSGSIMLITHPGQLVGAGQEPSIAFRKRGGTAILEQLKLSGSEFTMVPISNR